MHQEEQGSPPVPTPQGPPGPAPGELQGPLPAASELRGCRREKDAGSSPWPISAVPMDAPERPPWTGVNNGTAAGPRGRTQRRRGCAFHDFGRDFTVSAGPSPFDVEVGLGDAGGPRATPEELGEACMADPAHSKTERNPTGRSERNPSGGRPWLRQGQ